MQPTANHSLPFEYGPADPTQPTPPTAMLQEIGQILKQHRALNRFGLVQIDHTAPLPPGQVMSESCDILNRQLHSVPTPKEASGQANVETQWRLDHPQLLKECTGDCVPDPDGHGGNHKPTTEKEPS
mgnify:CR=1 FL=1